MAKTVTRNRQTSAPEARPDHFHHWRIEEPSGQISRGVCKHCGVTKEFKNWLTEGDFITNEEHRSAA